MNKPLSFYPRLNDLLKFFVSKLSKFYSNTVEINSMKHTHRKYQFEQWYVKNVKIDSQGKYYFLFLSFCPAMPLAFKRKAIALNQLFLPAMSSPYNTLKIHINSTLLLLAWSATPITMARKPSFLSQHEHYGQNIHQTACGSSRGKRKVLPVLACPVGPLREAEEHNQLY